MHSSNDAKVGRFRWVIIFFLIILFGVNQVDKALLGWASIPIIEEFGLSNAEWGIVSGSFFWLFSISALVGGFLIDRIKTSSMITALSGSWAILQTSFIVGGGFYFLLFNRMALGFFEGPAWITIMKTLKNWLPKKELGRGLGMVVLGAGVFLSILSPLLINLMNAYTWRSAFVFMGIIGVVLTLLWVKIGKNTPEESRFVKKAELNWIKEGQETFISNTDTTVPWKSIFLSPAFLAIVLSCSVHYYQTVIFWTWSPKFASDVLNVTTAELSLFVVIGNVGAALGAVVSGYIADFILKKTNNGWYSRGLTAFSGTLLSGVFMMQVTRSTTFIEAATYFGLLLFFNYFALNGATTLLNENIPSSQTGRVLGTNFMIYSSMGIIAPVVSGYIIEANSYQVAFDVAGYMAFGAAIVIFLFMKPSKFNFNKQEKKLSVQVNE